LSLTRQEFAFELNLFAFKCELIHEQEQQQQQQQQAKHLSPRLRLWLKRCEHSFTLGKRSRLASSIKLALGQAALACPMFASTYN